MIYKKVSANKTKKTCSKSIHEFWPSELMSVSEMGDVLGLKKTERYWLLHKNFFESRVFSGRIWVLRESFEKWYSNQDRYHKVNGEPPGSELKQASYSAEDMAKILGIHVSTAYEIIRSEQLKTVTVNNRKRVPVDCFEKWYSGQGRYRNMKDREQDDAELKESLSMPEMAALLGTTRDQVYKILQSKRYRNYFDAIKVNGQKRITWDSFNSFLNGQEEYHLYYPGNTVNNPPEENGKLANYRKRKCLEAGSRKTIGNCEYLTTDEAAIIASVSRTTIYNWMQKGLFPVTKARKFIRISRREFETWVGTRSNGTGGL